MSKKLAKLTPPRFRAVYPRRRLFNKLDSWANTPALWVTAPAGAGKTTLIASFLQAGNKTVCWYQMDEGDADLTNFFYYLGLLAGQHTAGELPAPTPEYRLGGIQIFARQFFRAFYAGLPEHAVWVLDNYQDAGNASLDEVIAIALQEIPPGQQVILISREPPPPMLARLLATQHMHILGQDELRLTPEETKGICALHRPGVEAQFVQGLHGRTQGWAAGVMLLLEQEKPDAAITATVKYNTRQTLFDYFASEVLQRATPQLQEILLNTAFIPHITVEMAVTLTGNQQAGELLDALASRNYFTYRHEGETLHYEYHPLFADFLKKRVQRLYAEAKLKQLRSRSARLLADAGRDEQAFTLYFDAGDWPAAIGLITRQAPLFLKQGRDQIIHQWIRQLPATLLAEQAWLPFWLGASTLATDPHMSQTCFEQAYHLFLRAEDQRGAILSWIGAVDAIIYSLSHVARLDRWLERFEQLRARYPQVDPEMEGQLASRIMSIIILRQPDHPGLYEWRNKAELSVRHIADINQRIISGFYLCVYKIWCGELSAAATLIEGLLPDNGAALPPLAYTTYRMARAFLAWSSGEFAACDKYINEGLAMAEESGVYVWYAMLLMQGSTNAFIHDLPDKAEAYQTRLAPQIIEARDMDRAYYYIDRAWLRLSKGEKLQALECQQRAIKAAQEFDGIHTLAQAYYGMAQVQHELGDQASAQNYLHQARDLGRRYNSWTMAWQCGLAEAQFALDRRDEAGAVEQLRAVLQQAGSKGVVTFNGWRPTVIARLCALALRHDICCDLVLNLIRHYHLPAPQEAPTESWPWPVRIRTLGRFVLEVKGKPVDLGGNKHRRPCDLLKLLIAAEPHGITEARLAGILWPGLDGDTAMRNLRTNLHRLRRLLGNEQAVLVKHGHAGMNTKLCWYDTHELQQMLCSIPAMADHELPNLTDKLLDDYSDAFLPSDEGALIIGYRQKLHRDLLHGLLLLKARLLDQAQDFHAARVAARIAALSGVIEEQVT